MLVQNFKTFTVHYILRGFFLSAHELLNLSKELGNKDKMLGLPSILSLICKEFNKFNNTGARILDSFYHLMVNDYEIAFLA